MQSDAALQAMYDVYANDASDESKLCNARDASYANDTSVANEARYASTASDASGGAGIWAGQHRHKKRNEKANACRMRNWLRSQLDASVKSNEQSGSRRERKQKRTQ